MTVSIWRLSDAQFCFCVTMSMKGFFRRQKSNMSDQEKKAKLGLKIVLAQQNPAPVYDLSDCEMTEIPSDTFVMCKLLQKTSLFLQNNFISVLEKGGNLKDLSSLTVLDLSKNQISQLPNTIEKLHSLQILKLDDNKLKNLPLSFGSLQSLEELSLSSNKFSSFPSCLCALPRLKRLSINGSNIKVLPSDFCQLQKTLEYFELDAETLQSPYAELMKEGLIPLVKHCCTVTGVEYTGPIGLDRNDSLIHRAPIHGSRPYEYEHQVEDDIMNNYMRRKQEQARSQMAIEEEFRTREKQQLTTILNDTSHTKKYLLDELNLLPVEVHEYAKQRQEKLSQQIDMEAKFRMEEAECLGVYLNSTVNKDAMMDDLNTHHTNLEQQVLAIIAAKDRERERFVHCLATIEQKMVSAVEELMMATQAHRSDEFLQLQQQQEQQMQYLLMGVAEASVQLRKSDVVVAMKAALIEEAALQARRKLVQEEQEIRVSALLREACIVNAHIEEVLISRQADLEVWVNVLSEDEECQAAAFRLLLLKTDLQRGNILRQIGLVEYELTRISSLEVQKQKLGVQYGSTTMMEQRKLLADLLEALLLEKRERERQLADWLRRMEAARLTSCDPNQFWLVQYQRLLALKPSGLAEAEACLESEVRAVLLMANAADLMPIFAEHQVTFNAMLQMTEEQAASMGLGTATYHSLQRALIAYLEESKFAPGPPSAPVAEGQNLYPASAPADEGLDRDPVLPLINQEASAPLLEEHEQYVEPECVVCMGGPCQVVFLPCGHVCTCAKCCLPLATCPMCRVCIDNRVLLS